MKDARSSQQIRQQFLDFFASKGHAIVPSSPVVPHDDPTLMFTNAGMNQFKDVFLGTGTRPYRRAADSQKCIRAGGKHNDLDDVGQDTYHHTFFEMLGNWSFGDYFKAEAITWAWELLTGVWGIEKDRLHATFFEGDAADGLEPDDEAARLWRELTDIDPQHIHPGSKKDNFWEMGDTGPCGPCSEIHIDLTPDKSGRLLVNLGDARVIEIWNLVFIQYNRGSDGVLTPLPARHVDTGMGFERICAVLQRKPGNYDTDVFTPVFDAIRKRTGAPAYTGRLPGADGKASPDRQTMIDVSYRVVADHVRCVTFALTDGAVPSNEGRGYVLRRILRRAVRYGRQYMDMHEPFLCDLVPAVVDHMADSFPELRSAHNGNNVQHVIDIIRDEEESFGRTLDRGIRLWWQAAGEALVDAFTREQKQRPRSEQAVIGLTSPVYYEETGETSDPIASLPPDQWHVAVHHPAGRRERFKLTELDAPLLRRLVGSPVAISGVAAFELHDTYGFPIDLTELMARERGLTVDISGYEQLMREARERARAGARPEGEAFFDEWRPHGVPVADDSLKYAAHLRHSAQIIMLHVYHRNAEAQRPAGSVRVDSGRVVLTTYDVARENEAVAVVSDRTCFYAESGGQVSDTGIIRTDTGEVAVTRVKSPGIHYGYVKSGEIHLRQRCILEVNTKRRATMKNHTSTHMLNWALREVLGPGVLQKGSLVDPEKTRFDFSHNKPMTPEEIVRVETLVNEQIAARRPVYTKEVDQARAREINTLRAVFGEKYPDMVRVVSVGADIDRMLADPKNPEWMKYPVEFCGGTHLSNSAEADHFALISEEGVAKGVRRVVGITGQAARDAEARGAALLEQVRSLGAGQTEDLAERVATLQREIAEATIPLRIRYELQQQVAELQKAVKESQKKEAAQSGQAVMDRVAELFAAAETINGVTIVVGEVPHAPPDALRGAIDWVRNKTDASAVLLATHDEGKVTLIAGMSKAAVAKGLKAGDLIRDIVPLVGGKGGGRPDMAQGGGTDPQAIPQAVQSATQWLRNKLE